MMLKSAVVYFKRLPRYYVGGTKEKQDVRIPSNYFQTAFFPFIVMPHESVVILRYFILQKKKLKTKVIPRVVPNTSA
jgi:hypothetical protein